MSGTFSAALLPAALQNRMHFIQPSCLGCLPVYSNGILKIFRGFNIHNNYCFPFLLLLCIAPEKPFKGAQ